MASWGRESVFRSDQRARARHTDCGTRNLACLRVRDDIGVAQSTGAPHQIDDHFVSDPDDHVVAHIGIGHIGRGVVGKHRQGALDERDVIRRIVDQQINVFGESRGPVSNQSNPPIST